MPLNKTEHSLATLKSVAFSHESLGERVTAFFQYNAGQSEIVSIMGVWGISLYSGDYAMDLRTTIAAVVRLPFNPEKLVDVLCENESAANDPNDEEHTTFWLVVADQFAKRGLTCNRVRDKALGIIDKGGDVAALERLGMKTTDLRKRQRVLQELRARIIAGPGTDERRNVLHKPQPLLMDIGDVMIYPTCAGKCINPYFASKELEKGIRKMVRCHGHRMAGRL